MSTPPPIEKFTVRPDNKDITVDEPKCKTNFAYWQTIPKIGTQTEPDVLELSQNILPAHTFAYHYLDDAGKRFYPIESIFGYDRRTNTFNPKAEGLKAKAFRSLSVIPDLHMDTSKRVGHDIFLFAYHGVHNPYHRLEDDLPVRPFGLFIKTECEKFGYCHGTPCDIADVNPEVDKTQLDKYYLLPKDLRILKANQIIKDPDLKQNFWYYYGNPEIWKNEEDYGKHIYRRTGEFRYYATIKPESIAAILWPRLTDVVGDDNMPIEDDNFEYFYAFRSAFPDIQIIQYNHDFEDTKQWEFALVEASQLSTKFFLEKGYFPSDIEPLKKQ